ncbi:kinesin-like protein KIF22 [Megalops cyprinoides]|uniref:kinesin-like protein KIF22 n=1 Tax=Megalops cyprinoides TaxID=118141 RepID=UPI0018643F8F|nr:kinesin-like protein KIF22 [Megalops cyprinoides]
MAHRVPVCDAGGSKRTSRVRVAVRLRPYMEKQDDKGEGPCVRGLGSQSLEIINWRNSTETLQYQFDAFYGEQTTQQEVFMTSVKPILPHLLNGQNASVFAYGPTGAGKTHTMLGSQEQPGVIPRAVKEVFHLVRAQEKDADDWDYTIGMSYLEIYNEKVLDLLSPNTQDLPIREDKDRNILIPGLTHMPLSSLSDFQTHFIPASLNRTTASTKLNHRSSRSHAILLIKVVKSQRIAPHRQQTGKLYLVDLAGSEDNRRTGNQGLRLKESGAINLSLFTLSKVVDSLNTGGGRVPYRDSKLTRLLQDSLGGSAHSVMITNIAPEYKYYFDTFTALNFAAKSKLIVNRPFVRETVSSTAEVHKTGKRPRQEQGCGAAAEPQKKKLKDGRREEQEAAPGPAHQNSPTDSSVLDRLLALEKLMMGSPEKERLNLLKTVAESRKEIQQLKAKQKELEKKALAFKMLSLGQGKDEGVVTQSGKGAERLKDTDLFRTNLLPLHRKQSSAAKPKKQQAVVTPLQVSQVQPLQQCAVMCKSSPSSSKSKRQHSEILEGKENMGVKPCLSDSDWESRLDGSVLEQSRQKILQVLNSGSLKDLKALQLIGDKKAKLILGWREVHGQFTQVEDLQKVEGITAKRFSSFMKANILSAIGK